MCDDPSTTCSILLKKYGNEFHVSVTDLSFNGDEMTLSGKTDNFEVLNDNIRLAQPQDVPFFHNGISAKACIVELHSQKSEVANHETNIYLSFLCSKVNIEPKISFSQLYFVIKDLNYSGFCDFAPFDKESFYNDLESEAKSNLESKIGGLRQILNSFSEWAKNCPLEDKYPESAPLMKQLRQYEDNGDISINPPINRDRVHISFGNRIWTLMQGYIHQEEILPYEEYFRRTGIDPQNAERASACLLKTECSLSNEINSLIQTADDLLRLLSFPLNQELQFNRVFISNKREFQLVELRPSQSNIPGSGAIIGTAPGSNELSSFLQTAEPIYLKNKEWWNLTIGWYNLLTKELRPEKQALTGGMLLERIGNFAYKNLVNVAHEQQYRWPVFNTLLKSEKKLRKSTIKLATRIIKRIDKKWNMDKTGQIFQAIERYNPEGSKYDLILKKLESMLQPGVSIPDDVRRQRNYAAHEGIILKELSQDSRRMIQFVSDSCFYITVFLLNLFHYRGSFSSLDRTNQEMSEIVLSELPQYKRNQEGSDISSSASSCH